MFSLAVDWLSIAVIGFGVWDIAPAAMRRGDNSTKRRVAKCKSCSIPPVTPRLCCETLWWCSVNLGACRATGAVVAPVKIAHGVLMAVSWGVALPIGVIIARFYRHKEPTTGPYAWWFIRHQIFQYSGVITSLAGFALALYMKWQTAHFDSAHAKLGLTVMIIGFLQPLNAFIRPKPNTPKRPLWNFFHKNLGYVAVVLAIPTIFLGLSKIGAPTGYRVAYSVVMAVLVGFYFVKLVATHRRAIAAKLLSISQRQGSFERLSSMRDLSNDHGHAQIVFVTENDDDRVTSPYSKLEK